MARFYLDVDYKIDHIEDDDGAEYVDLAHACADAAHALRELVANAIRDARKSAPLSVTVRDPEGRTAATIYIADILPPEFLEGLLVGNVPTFSPE